MKILCSIFELTFLILYIIFPFFHSNVPFFFFFSSCFFSTTHVYPLPLSLFLSPTFSFFYFLFLFLLDFRTFSNSLCDKKWRKRLREKDQGRDLACSTVDQRTQVDRESAFIVPSRTFCSAATHLPPQHSSDGSDVLGHMCFTC